MNDTSVACFLSVARTGSFTTSAQELSSTQQAVSRNVQALEEELGFSLLDRSGRAVTLTWEGSRFYQWCLDGDRQLAMALSSASRLMDSETNSFRLGWCDWTGCPDEISESLRAFSSRYPNCAMDFRQGTVSEVLDFLRDGELDLAILPETCTHNLSGFTVSPPFMELPLCAITNDRCTFPNNLPTPTDLTPMKQLVAHFGDDSEEDVLKRNAYLCTELGIYPEHLAILPNVMSTYSELPCGPCYTLAPRTSYAQRRGNLRFYPLAAKVPLVFVRAQENALAWVLLFETFLRSRGLEP
jgi:DNA-binding transcriptional LysR family regulator